MSKKRKQPNPLERKPDVKIGKPVIKGTRITVDLILDKLVADVSILGVLSLLFVAGVTWLDSTCFFELFYPLRWFVGAIYLALAWSLLRGKPNRVIAATSLIWMLVVLPQVRWNHAKSFYVDARRLARGMTVDEVRAIMDPHMELGVDELSPEERSWVGETPDPRDALVFLHCALGWTDHCEVLLDRQGRAREILIVKD